MATCHLRNANVVSRSFGKMTSHRGLLHHQIIMISDLERSSRFYGRVFRYLGYELAGASHDGDHRYEDWKRWDLDTPHEISICQTALNQVSIPHVRGATGHHHHIAFCAADRTDVDTFHTQILVPLAREGLCQIEDPPGDCPEYGAGYYATFFFDPDGLKYEFVYNPDHRAQKEKRRGPMIPVK